ncbi:MAG: HEAT repeat domain-containing protein [Bacillota bacterium]
MAYDLDRILVGMGDADDTTRLSAAYALEEALKEELEAGRTDWAPLVERLLPVLIEGIGDSHKGVQVHSANCLEFLAYQSERVIPALRAAMAAPDSWRAWGAAIVFARMGLWAPEVGPALSAAMGARDRDVRWAAASYALQLGRKHPEAVAMVKRTIQSEQPLARKMAAYCLGAMGEFAAVEPDLAAHLDDPEMEVRRSVILALDKLPRLSEPVKQRIAAMRQDPDPFVQRTADAVARKLGR